MDEIKELIKIVTEYTRKNIPLIDLKKAYPNGNKEFNLFLGIRNGEFNSELEASSGIYGNPEIDFKFRMLKSRLNRKLLNHLFFVDFTVPGMPRSAALHQECLDYLHFSRMLIKIGEKKLAVKLVYKTVDMAKTGEFTDIVIAGLKELRGVYAETYRPKLFQNISEQIDSHQRLQAAEEDAYAVYYENKLVLNSSVNNRRKDYQCVLDGIQELETKSQQWKSYNIYGKYLKLKLLYHRLTGEHDEQLAFSRQIEEDFRRGRINQNRLDPFIYNEARICALFRLKRYNEAQSLVQALLQDLESPVRKWYRLMQMAILIAIYERKYDVATSYMIEVLDQRNFGDSIEPEQLLRWNIIRAYLYHFTQNKLLLRDFNYEQFVGEIPTYTKDRAGLNTALLILQFMEQIGSEIGDLHRLMQALEDYLSKYLNNSFSKRAKTFGKLLQKVVAHNREYETVLNKSRYLEERMSETPFEGEQHVDFEVVPFEHLWDSIKTRLSRR